MKTKTASLVVAIAGLGLATLLIGWFGFHRVLAATLSVGWAGFGILIAWQFGLFALLGVAWWALLVRGPPAFVLIWARMVRDSAANCLPLSAVGGFVFGARAATLGGLSWAMATASTLADATSEYITQLVFALIGLGVLLAERPDSSLVPPFALGIFVGAIAAAVFVGLQRGAAPLARRLVRRLSAAWLAAVTAHIELMHAELAPIYARPMRFLLCSVLHLLGWFVNGAGGWLIMRLIGTDIGLVEALAIEGLLQTALTATFFVPGFAGVQEAAYVVLGGAFGLSPEAAIAVSLVRRARDIALGVPVLLAWQFVEVRRLQPATPG